MWSECFKLLKRQHNPRSVYDEGTTLKQGSIKGSWNYCIFQASRSTIVSIYLIIDFRFKLIQVICSFFENTGFLCFEVDTRNYVSHLPADLLGSTTCLSLCRPYWQKETDSLFESKLKQKWLEAPLKHIELNLSEQERGSKHLKNTSPTGSMQKAPGKRILLWCC